jgi:hypothetical protein
MTGIGLLYQSAKPFVYELIVTFNPVVVAFGPREGYSLDAIFVPYTENFHSSGIATFDGSGENVGFGIRFILSANTILVTPIPRKKTKVIITNR